MTGTSHQFREIFQKCIAEYHKADDVNAVFENPFEKNSFENLLFEKCRIDTVQWHLEDTIRDPEIEAAEALNIKRKIDALNQSRTNIVEKIDDYFLEKFKNAKLRKNASFNTESPAWAIDRLSILELKIYHMKIESERTDIPAEQKERVHKNLQVLLSQRDDLSTAIDQLLEDISTGKKMMKVYKQFKMYNDENLNPVLYQQKSK